MSTFNQNWKRNGRFTRRPDSHGKGPTSYNARITSYTNGVPRGGSNKPREPKRLKTKRKYAHVKSKYSSVFSRYLKEPTYPPSVKSKKFQKGTGLKNHQDRLVMRIFGNENNYKMIKSLMNNKQQLNKSSNEVNESQRPPLSANNPPKDAKNSYYTKPSTEYVSHQPSDKQKAGDDKTPKDKDFEVKLERALLDLSEHKNNFYK